MKLKILDRNKTKLEDIGTVLPVATSEFQMTRVTRHSGSCIDSSLAPSGASGAAGRQLVKIHSKTSPFYLKMQSHANEHQARN